jgi:hypothetical protein
MITPDNLPVWFAIPVSVALMVTWFVIELRAAPLIDDSHPESETGLDVLEKTGRHPH